MAIPIGAILSIVGLGLTAVTTPVFLLFILEEAVQAAGFGVFTLMQGKLWSAASRQNAKYKQIVQSGKDLTAAVKGYLNTITFQPAVDKMEAFLRSTGMAEEQIKIVIAQETAKGTFTQPGLIPSLSFLSDPFERFFEAAESTALAYDERIAEQLARIKDVETQLTKPVLNIDSTPGNARIYINDVYIKHLTPETVTLDPGSHKIRLEKKGFPVFVITFKLDFGETVTLRADLTTQKFTLDVKREEIVEEVAPPPTAPPTEEIVSVPAPLPPGEEVTPVPPEEEIPFTPLPPISLEEKIAEYPKGTNFFIGQTNAARMFQLKLQDAAKTQFLREFTVGPYQEWFVRISDDSSDVSFGKSILSRGGIGFEEGKLNLDLIITRRFL